MTFVLSFFVAIIIIIGISSLTQQSQSLFDSFLFGFGWGILLSALCSLIIVKISRINYEKKLKGLTIKELLSFDKENYSILFSKVNYR